MQLSRLRVRAGTFNLLHGLSLRSGAAAEPELAEAARRLDADVLGLQEVDQSQPRSGGADQTAVVAAALGAAHWRFVPALHGTPGLPGQSWRAAVDGEPAVSGPAYGVGLVSRWPVRHWAVLRFGPAPVGLPLLVPARPRPRLQRVPDEPRVAVLAVLESPNGPPLTVITAHLSFVPGFNARQLRAAARWAARFPAPRLLLGDFNLPGAVPARLTGWQRLARVATYPSYAPRVQFDHVLSSGLAAGSVSDVRSLQLPVSDHCGLVVDLDVPT